MERFLPSYIVRRLLQLIPVLFLASVAIFAIVRLSPSDPAILLAGGRRSSPETLAAIRAKYRLGESLPRQYLAWAAGAIRGDLGESYRLKQSVSAMIAQRLPVTLQLILMSMALSLAAALPLGVVAAANEGRALDRMITAFALAALSSPVFLTGIVGMLVFAYYLGWLPAFGSGAGFVENLRYLLLPSIALALNMLALSLRVTRNGMIEALGSNYVQTAIAKGLPRRVVLLKHAFRNALIPLSTVTGLQIGFLLTGTVLVEYTFGIGGIGSLLVNGIQSSDYPVIQGATLFVVAAFLLVNLAVDLLYAAIDPRIRYS
jgi:peptide/nickel transport system permease protein